MDYTRLQGDLTIPFTTPYTGYPVPVLSRNTAKHHPGSMACAEGLKATATFT